MSDPSSRASVPETRFADATPVPVVFSCSRRADGADSTCLVLSGELDLTAQSGFRQELDGALAASDRVLLDLSALTLIDCAGLFVLFAAAERCGREGTALTLHSPRGQVGRMLDLVGPPDGVVVVLDRGDLMPDGESAVAA